jgi:hypothetical protein
MILLGKLCSNESSLLIRLLGSKFQSEAPFTPRRFAETMTSSSIWLVERHFKSDHSQTIRSDSCAPAASLKLNRRAKLTVE